MISKQTNVGAELIAYCAANNIAVPLTTIKYGVGSPASEADIVNLTDLISIQGSVPITAKTQQTNTVFCEGQISNVTPVQITTGFLLTEAGVYGTDPRTSIETLIQYDWYNDGGLYFPPASVGEVTKNTSLGIVVGSATTVISQWNGSNVLATKSNLADAVTSIMGGTFIPQYAIQDPVTKIAGNIYRDNNDGYNYYCITSTNTVVNSTTYFTPFTNKVLSDRLDNYIKTETMSVYITTKSNAISTCDYIPWPDNKVIVSLKINNVTGYESFTLTTAGIMLFFMALDSGSPALGTQIDIVIRYIEL